MSIVDVDILLQELSAEAPCGPNLEYDAAFLALEKAALGKAEVQYGETITAAVAPEWKQVKTLSLDLLARSRDLRVAVSLLRALLMLHGIPGFADGARLIERLLDERWESVHPQLDPDDDLDPMSRINTLATLADATTVLRELKDCAFLQLPGLGPLSLRTLEMACGELPTPEGQAALSMASLEAALRDADAGALAGALQAASQARASIVNIEVALVRRVGSSQALSLDQLTRGLRRMSDFLALQSPAAACAVDAAARLPSGAASAAINGEIDSRADVVRMLDKMLSYYARCEPSSPVPMLLERAKRLAPKSFFEILQDLAPDSLGQVELIRGPLQDQ